MEKHFGAELENTGMIQHIPNERKAPEKPKTGKRATQSGNRTLTG